MGSDGCRADIKGDAVRMINQSGPNGCNARAAMHRDGHGPFTLAECLLETTQNADINLFEIIKSPLIGKRQGKAFKITKRIMHVWFFDDAVMQPDRRVHFDIANFGAFADDLFVHLTIRWHIDDDVAPQQRVAA